MLLLEIFGIGEKKAEKKRQAAIDKVRAKEAAKTKEAKASKARSEKQAELQKEIDAGEKRRANSTVKNAGKRKLEEGLFGKKDDGGQAAKEAFRQKKKEREAKRAANERARLRNQNPAARTPGHGADKRDEAAYQRQTYTSD